MKASSGKDTKQLSIEKGYISVEGGLSWRKKHYMPVLPGRRRQEEEEENSESANGKNLYELVFLEDPLAREGNTEQNAGIATPPY